ncbi:MAG TPA: nucleoside monophosphate kinase [Candidatus Moranbacteria bacterium]|nr:nucleoside monophosphate kinase [Candidatus Moranbacteria bacterium]HRY28169.1 nucleoside monophosphate kinase [Candidatus Moranbacteria bacterium]HSA08636.1 nucleoside monophosphate kinase [Candidatus Moranbacteria bacterium]
MKYEKEFPLFKIKVEGVTKKFNLSDVADRKEYFESKVGEEIKKLKEYFNENKTFIVYLLGKKNAGKGTYTKLMMEIFGKEKIAHISVGDVVRDVHTAMEDENEKKALLEYLKNNYRGYISPEDGINALLSRDQKTLLPNEFIMALVKREIDKTGKKSLFLDGFPRNLDQVSYSLFFKELIDYRQDPDIFAAIDIPEAVIDERMKYRVVCPICHTPRNLKLLATQKVGYDEEKKEFYLMCDNAECNGAKMGGKEGDNMGIESIRDRLEMDGQLIDKVFSGLHGVSKIFLRNAVPVDQAKELVDDYEITPAYSYELDEANKTIKTIESPFVVKDDEGAEVYSLLAPPVVVSLIKGLVKVLGL